MSQAGQGPDAPGAAVGLRGPAGRHGMFVLFLVLVTLAVTLQGTGERDLFTAHEGRAARCARAMLESGMWPGDAPSPWLVPQFSPTADFGRNYQKPPLYYWLAAGLSAVAGEVSAVTVRLPSALAMVGLVVVTYALGRALVSTRTGLLAALVLLSTPKVLWWSRAAILDPMLAACVAGSLLFFFRAHTGRGRPWEMYLFWGLAGLGTLVKATALVVPLLTVGLYLLARAWEEGLWRPVWRLRPVTGLLVLAAVAAPWHVAAHVATDGEFSAVYWGRHVFGRASGTGGFEEQTAWYFYFGAAARDLFPWVVFLPGALVQPWRRVSREHRGRLLFPLAWFVGSFVFFSAVSFRKDEYLLVAYPAAALLVGYFLDYFIGACRSDAALRRWVPGGFWLVAGVVAVSGAGLVALAVSPGLRAWPLDGLLTNETSRAVWRGIADLLASQPWAALLMAGPVAVGSVASAVLVQRHRTGSAVLLLAGAMVLAFAAATVGLTPMLNRSRGLAGFAAEVRAEAFERGPETVVLLGVAECHELAFELETDEWSPAAVLNRARPHLAEGRPVLVILDREWFERLKHGAGDVDLLVVAETAEGHRRPMVLVEPTLRTETPERERDG